MKPLPTAAAVGMLSAVVVWLCANAALREPPSIPGAEGSLTYVICGPDSDAPLTALLWAAGAYILTFTPTLLLCQRRIRHDAFSRQRTDI